MAVLKIDFSAKKTALGVNSHRITFSTYSNGRTPNLIFFKRCLGVHVLRCSGSPVFQNL